MLGAITSSVTYRAFNPHSYYTRQVEYASFALSRQHQRRLFLQTRGTYLYLRTVGLKQRKSSHQKCHGIVDSLLTWGVTTTHTLTLESLILIHILVLC